MYYKRMADFLVGASAFRDIDSLLSLAIAGIEEGGPGGNWMQLGNGAISSFQTYWGNHNNTGQPTPTTSQIESLDSVNAAAGVWWLAGESDCGYTDWEGAISKCSRYNGTCGCACPVETAYGWTALFLAYGDAYQVSSFAYRGSHYPISPTGTQSKYASVDATGKCYPSGYVNSPGFNVGTNVYATPYGRNGKQIVLLAGNGVDGDYVSCLQININLQSSGYMEAEVTGDATFAAHSTQDSSVCVIAVGAQAVTNINNACANLGLSCKSYSSFSQWQSGGGKGYINADGATGYDSYNLGDSAALSAGAAGW